MKNPKLAFVLKAAFVIVLAFGILRLLDVLMAWQIYSWIFQPIYEQGVNEKLAGILAVWITAAIVVLGPTVLLDLLVPALLPDWFRNLFWERKRRYRRAVYLTATGFTIWASLMFIISGPGSGELFNKITGKPWYVYSHDAKGEIVMFPKGVSYNPVTGETVKELTPEVAKKLIKEQPKAFRRITTENLNISFSEPVQFSRGVPGVTRRLDRITATKKQTEIWFSAFTNDTASGELLPTKDAYLTDEAGRVYKIREDKGEYETTFRWIVIPDKKFRLIRPAEVYQYSVAFDPIDTTGKILRLFDEMTPTILIDLEKETVVQLYTKPREAWDPEGYYYAERTKREALEALRVEAQRAAEARANATAQEAAEKARIIVQEADTKANTIAQEAAEKARIIVQEAEARARAADEARNTKLAEAEAAQISASRIAKTEEARRAQIISQAENRVKAAEKVFKAAWDEYHTRYVLGLINPDLDSLFPPIPRAIAEERVRATKNLLEEAKIELEQVRNYR